jgi:tRNA(adenine34) deaminase
VTDEELMALALEQASLAALAGEVPVGCVIVSPTGQLLASAQNRRERDEDPTAHAEIIALRHAGHALGTWRLEGCTLAVTLEPCPMCAGALVNARIARLIYGTPDPKAGATGTLMNLCQDPRLNHRLDITPNILPDLCAEQLRDFFRQQRAQGKK